MMRAYDQLLLSFFVGMILSVSVYGQRTAAEKVTIPKAELINLYRMDTDVYRSEQPTKTDFGAFQKYGIREVLNLRNRHSDTDEASGTAIKLHRVKMKAHSVSEDQLIEALRVIKNRKGPIVIHCHHGSDRTGAVCAMYRVVFQGVSKQKAIQEMTGGGFGFHGIYKNIIRVIEEADVEHIKREVGVITLPPE